MNLNTASQLAVDGFINGTAYGLLGLSFGLILHVTGRFHFAYTFVYTIAAYVAADLSGAQGVPFWIAVVIGLAVAVASGVLMERVVYRPLARHSGPHGLMTIFVASLGLSVAGENAIRLIWSGSASQSLTGISINAISVGGVTFTSIDVISVAVLWALAIGVAVTLRYTKIGRIVTAARVNPEMAQIIGINLNFVYLLVFAVSSLLAGILADLAAIKYAAQPDMGFKPLLYAFVIAFIGGATRPPLFTVLAGVIIGLVESLSGIWLSAQWSSLVVFVILFGYLSLHLEDLQALLRTSRLRVAGERG
jgi:branched-chain amino acid transport system permease protein